MIPECSIAASGGSAPTNVGQINSLDIMGVEALRPKGEHAGL